MHQLDSFPGLMLTRFTLRCSRYPPVDMIERCLPLNCHESNSCLNFSLSTSLVTLTMMSSVLMLMLLLALLL